MARNRGIANTRANEIMGSFMDKMNNTDKSPVTQANNGNGNGDGDGDKNKKKNKSTFESETTVSKESAEAQIGENSSTTSTTMQPWSEWMDDPDVENQQYRTQTGVTSTTTTEPGKILAERGKITQKFKGTDEEYLQKLVKGGNYSNVTPDEMVEKGIIGKGYADWWGGHGYKPKTSTTETPINKRETRTTKIPDTPKKEPKPDPIYASTYAPLSDKRRGLRKTKLGNNRRISQPLTSIFGEKTYSIHSKNKKKQAAAIKHAQTYDTKVKDWYEKKTPSAKRGFQMSSFDTAAAYESGQVDRHRLAIPEEHRGQLLEQGPSKRKAKKMERSEKRWAMNKFNPENRNLSRKEMKEAYKKSQST